MFKLIIIFTIFGAPDGAEPPSARYEHVYASEAQCERDAAWWFEHETAIPRGWDRRWRRLSSPWCEPMAETKTLPPVA